jgi:NTP pyrophosphatase (non-canonical NTP hydrolase)
MTTELRHPRAIAIAKRSNNCDWDMADYLLEAAGRPSRTGINDGSFSKLKEVSDELVGNGFSQFTVPHLTRLRQAAYAFPKDSRQNPVSLMAHFEAGSPEVLQAVIVSAKAQGCPVSTSFVTSVMRGMTADQSVKRRHLEKRARAAADRAEAAGDRARADRNRTRAVKLRGAPKRDKSKRVAPKPEEVPMMVVKGRFMADSGQIGATIRKMDREIAPHIDDLSKAFVVGSVEELLELAEALRKLAAKLNRNQQDKRAHLHAVA